MQAQPPMQRQMHRRSPGAGEGGVGGPGPMPSNLPPTRSMPPPPSSAIGVAGPVAPRPSTMTSTRSTGSSSSRQRPNTSSNGPNANVPLSQIEKSVTHLLVATKQLLETLTQWSRGQATDTQVSDVYVRLGYEFNMACRAFTAINVDTSDLGNVPELLRTILEATLSQEASSESLEKYLPRIRDIIINLLHGLKRKQQKLRQKQARDRDAPSLPPNDPVARTASMSTTGSAGSGLTSILNDSMDANYLGSSAQQPQQAPPQQAPLQQQPSQPPNMPLPSRESSNGYRTASSPSRRAAPPPRDPMPDPSGQMPSAGPPYANGDAANSANSLSSVPNAAELNIDAFPPPPPPKSQQSALMALQRGDHLERRASRRYSQYHIQKHLGSSFSTGVPLLPPQTTPVPNRGRGEMQESMRAVQGRENTREGRSGAGSLTRNGFDSPSSTRTPRRPSDDQATPNGRLGESPMGRTPDSKYASPQVSATLSGPPPDFMPAVPANDSNDDGELRMKTPKRAEGRSAHARGSGDRKNSVAEWDAGTPLTATSAAALERSPPPAGVNGTGSAADLLAASPPTVSASAATAAAAASSSGSSSTLLAGPEPASKELTLFLQYKSKVKKFVLADGYSELTIGRLQLAFIEKFSWNTQQNGADLPEIYIQDPVSGVRHELEDLADIKDRTVLVLNVEALDEVKRHIDDGLGSIRAMVQQVKQNLDEQGAALQRVSDRQQETSKDMAQLAAAGVASAQPMTPPADSPRGTTPTANSSSSASASAPIKTSRFTSQQLAEVRSLRRDLAVLRQTYSDFQSDIKSSMTALRNKAAHVQEAAAKAVIPEVEAGSGQALVAEGRKKLNAESDRLVGKVDDLQDLVEDLRKDVVHRGVRPLPRQLESVTKDITQLSKDLSRMEETMKREKPVWTKIWEKELEEVCKGRDELQLAEDLLVDLRDDLEKASETFALVEQATKEQMKDAGAGGSSSEAAVGSGGGSGSPPPGPSLLWRSQGLRSIADNTGVDPSTAKEGVLGEVRALQPNHENRLEAIERAEKMRQKELANRRVNPLMKELTDFVEEGKLKKSGGFEEVERLRRAKDDQIRRQVWEQQNGMILDMGDMGDEELMMEGEEFVEGMEGMEAEGMEGEGMPEGELAEGAGELYEAVEGVDGAAFVGGSPPAAAVAVGGNML